jgi:hypothetical protein
VAVVVAFVASIGLIVLARGGGRTEAEGRPSQADLEAAVKAAREEEQARAVKDQERLRVDAASRDRRLSTVEMRLQKLEEGARRLDASQLKVAMKKVHLLENKAVTNGTDHFYVPEVFPGWKEPGDKIAEIRLPECKGRQVLAAWAMPTGFGPHGGNPGLEAFFRGELKPEDDHVVLSALRNPNTKNAGFAFWMLVLYR